MVGCASLMMHAPKEHADAALVIRALATLCGVNTQAVLDGSLAQALGSLRSQPQVLAAYSRTALLRDRERVTELQAALLRFKACCRALTTHPQVLLLLFLGIGYSAHDCKTGHT